MSVELLKKITEIAKEAGEIILQAGQDKGVTVKEGRANFVTEYDDRVQEFLIDALSKILPEAHFVGEEEGREVFPPSFERGFTFVIDPIDGTSNFMRGYDLSVTSIGLLKDGEPYIGVVYNPYSGQMFSAGRGLGAFENGRRLVSSPDPLSESLVSMGTAPYYEDALTKSAFELGHWYLKRSIDIRRSGSAAYDLCMVASGRVGLYYEPLLQVWDYCAGALIVEEAGGKVTDLTGAPLSFRGKDSVCAVTEGVARGPYLPEKEYIVSVSEPQKNPGGFPDDHLPTKQARSNSEDDDLSTKKGYTGTTDYALLREQVEALLTEEPAYVPALSNISALLMDQIEDLNWAGFYLLKSGRLTVGPFQGKPACIHIEPGRGVCGTSLSKKETIVVPDVHAFPGHIACDGASKSEIVIPILVNEEVIGVLDMDSPKKDRFSQGDRIGLEALVRVMEEGICWENEE